MNATIEAAKAQDYGKGFAVVASEVRNLAGRSRIAAEEIEQLVKSCVVISEQAGAILERLVPNSQKTANLVQEINAASSEQYMGAEQVNNAIQQLDQVIQQNASTADEMASSAEEFTSQVEQLREAMLFFTVKEHTEESQPEESSDLMQALQTLLNAKGADEKVLIAILQTMMAANKPQQKPVKYSHSDSTSSKNGKQEDGPSEEQVISSDGIEIEMQAQQAKNNKGSFDDEFELF
jgi:predicted house-cleaning noncanonical NTP pyrophosphatase (MazG superfamily)